MGGGGGALTKQLGGLGASLVPRPRGKNRVSFIHVAWVRGYLGACTPKNCDVLIQKLILVISGMLLSQEQYLYLVTGSHDSVTDASSQNIVSY